MIQIGGSRSVPQCGTLGGVFIRIVSFGFGGVSFGRNGAERFRSGFRVVLDENNKEIFSEVVDEHVKVSDSEQEPSGEIVDYN